MLWSWLCPFFPSHFPDARLALPVLLAGRRAILEVDLACAKGAADGLFAGTSQGMLAIALLPFQGLTDLEVAIGMLRQIKPNKLHNLHNKLTRYHVELT